MRIIKVNFENLAVTPPLIDFEISGKEPRSQGGGQVVWKTGNLVFIWRILTGQFLGDRVMKTTFTDISHKVLTNNWVILSGGVFLAVLVIVVCN